VLARNLDAFLALAADVVLRPRFEADELTRTKRELSARLDELRTDDPWLAARFFARRLYGAHGYGRPPMGTKATLAAPDVTEVRARWKALARGAQVVFAFAGDVDPAALTAAVERHFGKLPRGGGGQAPAAPPPRPPTGWRIQIVDKPDRQQVQIMFGHLAVPASHPDFLPLQVALTAFGGPAFNATLMDEVRSKRGLAYGAYMQLIPRRGSGPVRAHLSTAVERAVSALKLVLKLYGRLPKQGLAEDRVQFFRNYLVGSHAAEMDDPARRLLARVQAELHGLPPDHVDTLPARLQAVTSDDVNRAVRAHLHPADLAITLVSTASTLVDKLVKSGIDRGAIDVVPWDED
jgi:zinc protease